MLRNITNMNQKYMRKVTRVGKRSLAIVIPSAIVDKLKIKERQKLVVTCKGKIIIIKDYKKQNRKHDK